MQHFSSCQALRLISLRRVVAGLFCWLLASQVRAQAPAWALVTTGSPAQPAGRSFIGATAVDASGNVFVSGTFLGQVVFGNTTLTSAGAYDLFVAKYVPSTNTWAWAQRGGGTGDDQGHGIAVSGSNVYVTGYITNTTTNASGVTFGATGTTVQAGATTTSSVDLLVAKYTDNGSSVTLGWTQVGGGTGNDNASGVAVSGSSVYVTGYIVNTSTNANAVVFGGTGTTAGTVAQYGVGAAASNDLVLAKYTDNGATATLGWTQVGGGTNNDAGYSLAVVGSSVYLAGTLINDRANTSAVLLGGTGATPGTVRQNGASTTNGFDALVAKYTDNGTSATVVWTQVGGGTDADVVYAIAASGTSLYVAGTIVNTSTNSKAVVFGGSGTTVGTLAQYGTSTALSNDVVVVKYTDQGTTATPVWTQVGGGNGDDYGFGIAASGSSVYVVGSLYNNTANSNAAVFGGTGTTPGTAPQRGATSTSSDDVLVARYTDNGATATLNWTQIGGGTTSDRGTSLAVGTTNVYVGGNVTTPATFGSISLTNPTTSITDFLAVLPATVLAATPATTLPGLALYPNPAHGTATVRIPAGPGPATLTLLDALGRVVRTTAAPAGTDYPLSLAGLAPGLYALRVQAGEGQVVRQLVVE